MSTNNAMWAINMYRGRKICKREAPDDGWYTLFNHHNYYKSEWDSLVKIRTVSIDPATNNFALRIEDWYKRGILKGKVVPVLTVKESFKHQDPVGCNFIFQRLTAFLDTYKDLFKGCHYVIIERQLSFNYRAVRIGSHTVAYFLGLCAANICAPIIIEVNSKLKGKQLGAPKGINEKQLKSWSVEVAMKEIEERGDCYTLRILLKEKKRDDYADTVCQVKALFELLDLKFL